MRNAWKLVDSNAGFGMLFTDLSKVSNCLPHELLFAKLDSYGFDKSSLKLIDGYLSSRKKE